MNENDNEQTYDEQIYTEEKNDGEEEINVNEQREKGLFEKKLDELMEPLLMKLYTDPSLAENCLLRGAQTFVVGGAMGFAFGAFFSSFGPTGPFTPHSATGEIPVGWKAQTKESFKHMGRSAVSMSKGFAAVGGLYATSECAVEKYRGKSDLWNPLYAGCFSGGLLGVRGGPTATALGCVGFAAFSVGIDYLLAD